MMTKSLNDKYLRRHEKGLQKLESYIKDMRRYKFASVRDKTTLKLIEGLELLGVHRMIHIGDKEKCAYCDKVIGKVDKTGLSLEMIMDGIVCDHCSLKDVFKTTCTCTDKVCKTYEKKLNEMSRKWDQA